HVPVVGSETDLAVAHAEVEAPAIGRLPVRLHVGVASTDAVVLVAAQRTMHPKPVADEILVAASALLGHAVLHAGHQRERASGRPRGPAPAQVRAAVLALQVD